MATSAALPVAALTPQEEQSDESQAEGDASAEPAEDDAKTYADVITAEAETDEGLFTVHKVAWLRALAECRRGSVDSWCRVPR